MGHATHIKLGTLGEELACQHLRRQGLQLLERNFRTRFGELDVIAFRSGLLIFCEVKTRRKRQDANQLPDPLISIHPLKRRQIRKMAGIWLAHQTDRSTFSEIRFDAIGIVLDQNDRLLSLDHHEGAF